MGIPPSSLAAAVTVLESAAVPGIPAPAKPGRLSGGMALAEPTASQSGANALVRVVAVAGKGRGVIAARRIGRGELIESAPVVVVPADQAARLDGTVLEHYVYDWAGGLAIALGNGSIYNHSYTPNAIYRRRLDTRSLEYVALRDLEEGEEILINYNGEPNDRTPLWFTVV